MKAASGAGQSVAKTIASDAEQADNWIVLQEVNATSSMDVFYCVPTM